MKFLKKFLTETAKSGYTVTNDMVSYVVETDKVYTTSLYKFATFKYTNEEDVENMALYGGSLSNTSTSTRSSVDRITIDGKDIDMSRLWRANRNGSNNTCICIYSEQFKTEDGHDIYESTNNNTECWLDLSSGVVRLVEDNSQLIINDAPCYCEIDTYNGLQVYYYDGTEKKSYTVGHGYSFVMAFEFVELFEAGEHTIELYSKDKDVKFDFAQNMAASAGYSNYTITKNVKYIGKIYGSGLINELTYEGTIAEFQAIEKENKWNVYYTSPRYGDYKAVTVVHCTDGDLNV